MSFYDATNSVNLDDVKTKLEQQAKDANKSVTDATKRHIDYLSHFAPRILT